MLSLRKRGGMWFWRLGPLGGSVYVTRKTAAQKAAEREQRRLAKIWAASGQRSQADRIEAMFADREAA